MGFRRMRDITRRYTWWKSALGVPSFPSIRISLLVSLASRSSSSYGPRLTMSRFLMGYIVSASSSQQNGVERREALGHKPTDTERKKWEKRAAQSRSHGPKYMRPCASVFVPTTLFSSTPSFTQSRSDIFLFLFASISSLLTLPPFSLAPLDFRC